MNEDEISEDAKIERLEISKEETESEIKFIEITIQKLDTISDELPARTTAREQIHIFKQKLEHEKEIQEEILGELEQSISFHN